MQGRQSTRASVPLLPRYRSSTGFEYVEGQCVDLSLGGMFIASSSPLESGMLVRFECQVSGEDSRLQGIARVVWQRTGHGDRSRPDGMGLKFVKLDPGSSELIAMLVKEAQSHGMTAPTEPLPAHYVLTESVPPPEPRLSSSGRLSVVTAVPIAAEEALAIGTHPTSPESQRVPAGTTPRDDRDDRDDAGEVAGQAAHAAVAASAALLQPPEPALLPDRPGLHWWLAAAASVFAIAAWALLQ